MQNYLKSMDKININFIEIGFRFLEKKEIYGNNAYCKDEFLKTFDIPKNLNIAVMLKAEEVFLKDANIQKNLDYLFEDSKKSPVDVVRIAAPYQKAPECQEITEILRNKGYKISLNLTKLFLAEEKEILKTVKKINAWNSFDILYFADTYGNLSVKQVKNIISIMQAECNKPLGFHSHNNTGLALINSLAAIEKKINYVDSTVAGMGRGAGNLPTETILKEIDNKKDCKELSALIKNYFLPLKLKYKWGYNLLEEIIIG